MKQIFSTFFRTDDECACGVNVSEEINFVGYQIPQAVWPAMLADMANLGVKQKPIERTRVRFRMPRDVHPDISAEAVMEGLFSFSDARSHRATLFKQKRCGARALVTACRGSLWEIEDAGVAQGAHPAFLTQETGVEVTLGSRFSIEIVTARRNWLIEWPSAMLHELAQPRLAHLQPTHIADRCALNEVQATVRHHRGVFCPPLGHVLANLEMMYRERNSGSRLYNPLRGLECEAKYTIADPRVINKLYDWARDGTGEFTLQHDYPYLLDRGLVVAYERSGSGVTKYVFWGLDQVTVSEKSLPVAGQSNVLVRKEKNSRVFVGELDMNLAGTTFIDKFKRAFWVIARDSGHIYHIVVDRCYSGDELLMQMELEYAGSRDPSATITTGQVEADISRLGRHIEKIVPSVSPTGLLKERWLGFSQQVV